MIVKTAEAGVMLTPGLVGSTVVTTPLIGLQMVAYLIARSFSS